MIISGQIFRFVFLVFCAISMSACGGRSSVNNPETGGIDTIQQQIAQLTKKIERRESNFPLYLDRARLFEASGKPLLAINDMLELIRHDSVNTGYWNYLGDLYLNNGSAKKALDCYQKSTMINQQNDYAFMKMGEIFLYLQNREKSFEYLNEALRINKHNPKLYYFKGMNYLEMQDTPKALSSFQTAVTVSPQFFDGYMNLGLIYAAKKDMKAVSFYQNALRLKENSVEVLYALGKFYQDIDSFDKAISEYNKILVQLPDHKNTNYNLGYIYYIKTEYDKAIQFFSTAISKQPDFANAYYGRGLCYKKSGKAELAENDFRKVLQLDPEFTLAKKELKKTKK